MLSTPRAFRGMVTAPHHLAAQAGLRVLRDGGNAIEAMIAAAATIPVVYPHMNAIGGDGFWIVAEPGKEPIGIDACGAAGAAVTPEFYRSKGHAQIPSRGPLAANTVAGTVAGWGLAYKIAQRWSGTMPLARLLEDAIEYAKSGAPVTVSQARFTDEKMSECLEAPGFAETFLIDGKAPAPGTRFKQPALGETLTRIAKAGPEDFYRGELARKIGADLARAGSPITADDLARHQAKEVVPLSLRLRCGTAYNMTPPTQGLASLLILGLFERCGVTEADGFDYVHALVESTKLAFRMRDRHVTDPAYMTVTPQALLEAAAIDKLWRDFDRKRAAPWPAPPQKGDTIWMGAIDEQGRSASFIQSIYWEFGSAVVLRDTGILWQNRGTSFSLDPAAPQALKPGRKPFHTLNPALARLNDGRNVVYGTMGGDGQPQTQAAIFTRYALFGQSPQQAVTAPRWLLGRTWGTTVTKLRLESRHPSELVSRLEAAGHELEVLAPFTDLMGHAGLIAHHRSGLIEGATDPRGDGAVAAF
ncbi:MAG TPA: gamma-glutamyltransferase family protein [Alphaproteobacteria bacterium]|nr:gamma-glutamyltransferase family protein [Alphaproteobacteria bacterium]